MTLQATQTGRQRSRDGPTEVPPDLETAQAKLCYLALDGEGPRTLEDLAASLDLAKLTLLDVLGSMAERGHVERDDRGRYAVC